jgi:hypothetical protein
VHCHVSKKVTFADVAVTFSLAHQQKSTEGGKKISSTLQGGIFIFLQG